MRGVVQGSLPVGEFLTWVLAIEAKVLMHALKAQTLGKLSPVSILRCMLIKTSLGTMMVQ